jgi:hypothetical protein
MTVMMIAYLTVMGILMNLQSEDITAQSAQAWRFQWMFR